MLRYGCDMLRTSKSKPAKSKRKPLNASTRMAAYRRRMRAAGFRPVQLWLPDTKSPKFIAECRRQAQAIAKAESKPGGDELMRWIEEHYEWPE